MSSTSILELSNAVATNTAKYHQFLVENNLPLPSHEPSMAQGPVELPPDIIAARDAAIQASYELHELLIGPYGLLLNGLFQSSRMLALDFIHTHQIADAAARYDEPYLFRTEHGTVAHTAASHVLATNLFLAAWIGVAAKEIWPAFLRTTEALTKWPGSEDPVQTSFSLAHNFTDVPFVEWEKDPPRARQFSDAMKFLHAGAQPEAVLDNFDFLGKDTVTFVDVGGSHGDAAIALAEKHPQLLCTVQDFLEVVQNAENRLPEHLKGRVTFMAHDFWLEQPVKSADIYYFRWIFHDWSDEYAVKILRQTIPALKPGARVIINDACVPPPGVLPAKQEMDLRTVDILMKAFTNAKEREAGDWQVLFKKADPRFKFLGISKPPSARDSVIQAEWVPDSKELPEDV